MTIPPYPPYIVMKNQENQEGSSWEGTLRSTYQNVHFTDACLVTCPKLQY